jgi:WD40 repeat protein
LKATFEGHTGDLETIAYSPDGKMLASSSGDLTARLWEVDTGKVNIVLEGHHGEVDSVAFSPDGRLVATGVRTRSSGFGIHEAANCCTY